MFRQNKKIVHNHCSKWYIFLLLPHSKFALVHTHILLHEMKWSFIILLAFLNGSSFRSTFSIVLFLYDSIIYLVKTCRICATPILFLRFHLNFNVSNDFPWMRTDDTIFNLKFESANIMIDTTLTHFNCFLKMVLKRQQKCSIWARWVR